MASRYTTGGNAGTSSGDPKAVSVSKTEGSTSTQSGTSNQTSNTQGNTSSTTNTTTRNMSKQNEAALNLLIQQLMGGGTQQMAEDRARRLQEVGAVQNQRADYSKGAAFADAQGAMAQQMRLAMEKLLPSIVRSAEGAGTSQNSLRALLTQQAASQAAEASSALGLKAATDYGGISTNLSSILERLTQQNDPVTSALVNALNVAKGVETTTKGTTTGTNNSTTNTTGNTTNTTVSQGASTSNSISGDAPMYSNVGGGALSYFGPNSSIPSVNNTAPTLGYTQNNAQALNEMLGSMTNKWAGFQF